MGTMTVTMDITSRVDITPMYEASEINPCKVHGCRPKLTEVYTGKRKKFQGVIADCKAESCVCYSYTAPDVIEKWNEHNPLNTPL